MEPTPQTLRDLLTDVPRARIDGDPDLVVSGMTHDSRRVRTGWLFVAYRGVYQDVHRYIPDAVASGAVAALVERPAKRLRRELALAPGFALVEVPNARRARADVAATMFCHPARHLTVVGVTGTDGKTTTTSLLHAMLLAAGRRAGIVSTVAAQIGDDVVETGAHVTTPEAEDVQALLADMLRAGMDTAVLEATSHGLHQHRLAAIDFDVAAITNITHNEALEYHGTFEAYREAKAMLFHALTESAEKPWVTKTAVLNAADPSFGHMSAIAVPRRITYSVAGPADFRATRLRHDADGLRFTAVTPLGEVPVESPLLGAYNAANMLAAMASAHALGVPPQAWRAGVAALRGIPGRMELVSAGQPFLAIVDFAHTPNALENALATAHELASANGRVIAVFGCAGERDPGKRMAMGNVAGRLADVTFVTAEDPRTEDLDGIMAAIAVGLREAGAEEGRAYHLVRDRAEAIRRACAAAGPPDVVIVCGKGHEPTMCFGDTEYCWDDRQALRAALEGRRYGDLPTAEEGHRPID